MMEEQEQKYALCSGEFYQIVDSFPTRLKTLKRFYVLIIVCLSVC